jgi:hypothetical protein
MISKLLISCLLMALCVVVHAIGTVGAMRWIDRSSALSDSRYWPPAWLFVRIAGWLVAMHLLDIAMWGLFYAWGEAFPNVPAAIYFSSVTYTTVGYGDLVLPPTWRLVGGIEALTGILMCGWSTGFFFSVVSRMHQSRRTPLTEMPQVTAPRSTAERGGSRERP